MRFYLGTHNVYWLWDDRFADVPLFVSHNRLRRRVRPFPRAVATYAVDSGAFTELAEHGRWTTTPEEYVTALRRYRDELGEFAWAAQQDWLCGNRLFDLIETRTGHRPTVAGHQAATVANYLRLTELAPDLPIVPTLQGQTPAEYLRCADMFEAAGVELASLPLVGVGSIVGLAPDRVEYLAAALHARGYTRLHGFGVKGRQIEVASHHLDSADSMSWSARGRRTRLPECRHKAPRCQNCAAFAASWYRAQVAAHKTHKQMSFLI